MMKTEEQLNKEILQKTENINNNYPELSEFINEMPVTIPNKQNPDINLKHLHDYNESLDGLLKKYAINHSSKNK